MPLAKNALIRYRIINACFTNRQKRYWTKKELIAELAKHDIAIKPRTLALDIENMRTDRLNFHAPIIYCHKTRAYHYEDHNFSINKVDLTEEELHSVLLRLNLLRPYSDTRIDSHFEVALEKMIRVVEQLRQAKTGESFIEFEKAPYNKSMDYIDAIWAAIRKRQTLCITHKKFEADEARKHVFHPYLLKESLGRFYGVGFSETHGKIISLGLDRVLNVCEEESIAYKLNESVKANEYFKHTIGVTVGDGPVEDIHLWFTPTFGHYIKTMPLHDTQKTIRDDAEGFVISLQLIINNELISRLLSHCPHVKVLQPLSLRKKLVEAMKEAIAMNEME